MSVFPAFVDDDSEPILGQWFEETLAPPDPPSTEVTNPSAATNESDSTNGKTQQPQQNAPESCSLIPDKGEPNGVSWNSFFLNV